MSPEEITQAIKEFKEIYRELKGIELDDEKATILATDLLLLFQNLLQIK